ncbi:MAG TPA: NUDIX domain-containing protein [Longimicrobiales bacterium]|nr:NUDIX domain-containing protein [Longimicrobiales bacterium]
MPDPVPSATLVLVRDGEGGLEVLLLERSPSAAFVPGAYVFPGGRVDPEDSAEAAVALFDDLSPGAAAERLDLHGGRPPAIAYYVAALREAFEETGIPAAMHVGARDAPPPTAAEDASVRALQRAVLEGRTDFAGALRRMGARVAGREIEYLAHWITPEGLPRRYDARFFIARVPPGAAAVTDPREITSALWIAPADALRGAQEGSLPMILPTVRTLERLAGFSGTAEALGALRGLRVDTMRPRLPGEPHGAPGGEPASRD